MAFKEKKKKKQLGEEYEYIFNRAAPGVNDGAIRDDAFDKILHDDTHVDLVKVMRKQ